MGLATKLRIIHWKSGAKSWAYISSQLGGAYSDTALREAYRHWAIYLARAAGGVSEAALTSKTTTFPDIDARLAEWSIAVRARGRKRVPLSLAILRCKAMQIAASPGISIFSASNGYLRN